MKKLIIVALLMGLSVINAGAIPLTPSGSGAYSAATVGALPDGSSILSGTSILSGNVGGTLSQWTIAQHFGVYFTFGTPSTGDVLAYSGTKWVPASGRYLVDRALGAPTNAINLGALSSGLLYGTVGAGISTISAKAIGTGSGDVAAGNHDHSGVYLPTAGTAAAASNLIFTSDAQDDIPLRGATAYGRLNITEQTLVGRITGGHVAALAPATVKTLLGYPTSGDYAPALLTGWTSGAGTVAATDSVREGMQKLDGNLNAFGSTGVDGQWSIGWDLAKMNTVSPAAFSTGKTTIAPYGNWLVGCYNGTCWPLLYAGGPITGNTYPAYASTGTVDQGTKNINIDGLTYTDYTYSPLAGTAGTYTPVITSAPASGVRYINMHLGGGTNGITTVTWTNVDAMGPAFATAVPATKYNHYFCIIPSSGHAKCSIIAEASTY